ncbi:major facilitator superfamily domain-containing protein [Rhizoctonia solani]|nr:major facilitator superfamily domain-containing protein [Rhizoctonia solani]
MNSDHNLLPAPRQDLVDIPHEVHGVASVHGMSQQLRRGQIYVIWVLFGAIVFLNSLIQWSAGITLQVSIEANPGFVGKVLQGNHLVYAFAPLVFGRLADLYSRPISSAFAVSFFILGSIVSATSPDTVAFAVGTIFHTIGIAGIGLLATLFIADYTSLRWRGMALSWTYLPSLIVVWAGPQLNAGIAWRWIYGMAAILAFALCTPAIYLLISAGRNRRATSPSSPILQPTKLRDIPSQMDLVGLLIFIIGFGLIEYGSTTVLITRSEISEEYPPGRIVMLVIGLLLAFPGFIVWELYFASSPLMPERVLRCRGMLLAIVIAFVSHFASSFPSRAIRVLLPVGWKMGIVGYFFSTQAIAYSAFSPLLGGAYYVVRRYKPFLLVGNALFIVGCALWLHAARHWDLRTSEGVSSSPAYLFTIQVLIGLGSIAIEMSLLIGSQASVTHNDLAIATALVFAWSQIAMSLGSSAAIAVSLRFDSGRTESIVSLGSALGLSLLCLLLSTLMPNFVLGDRQNAAEVEYKVEPGPQGAN